MNSAAAPDCAIDAEAPGHWTGTSPLLDLDDPKLRLRAQSLTQLAQGEHAKVLALYGFVKRIPYGESFKMRLHTAREVLQQDRADSADKATLLVALLRLCGVPARMRYLTLNGETMRGLLSGIPDPVRPLVEVYRGGRWVRTDTYIFDAPYLAAARRRLQEDGWTRGWGVHVDGATLWNGVDDAHAGKFAPQDDPMVLHDHGVFCDPLEFVSSPAFRSTHARLARAVQWNMLAVSMGHAIRQLRERGGTPPAPPALGLNLGSKR